MASIFSTSTSMTRSSNSKSNENRPRRSSSTSRDRRARVPALEGFAAMDVVTRIAAESARAVLIRPEVNLKGLLDTVENSRSDLNKSDTVIVCTSAILASIGNTKMSKELLKKSHTCAKYYSRLRLDEDEVREMYVTMLFSSNPALAASVLTAVQIAVARSAELAPDVYTDEQLASSIKSLLSDDTITVEEIAHTSAAKIEKKRANLMSAVKRRLTDPGFIKPSDSISEAGSRKGRSLTESDLMAYIARTKTGPEPEFGSVFTSAKPPVTFKKRPARAGLGANIEFRARKGHTAPVDDIKEAIMGRHRVETIGSSSGTVRSREPRVEDFLDSTSISGTAIAYEEDVASVSYDFITPESIRRPIPTDISTLPSSVYEEPETVVEPASTANDDLLAALMADL